MALTKTGFKAFDRAFKVYRIDCDETKFMAAYSTLERAEDAAEDLSEEFPHAMFDVVYPND